MRVSELIERLGRTVFEAPFGALSEAMGDSPEVAEIRIAVLDEIEKKIQRAGGKALFPYNVVRIVIRASGERCGGFRARFLPPILRRGSAQELVEGSVPVSRPICASRCAPSAKTMGVEGKWLRVETVAEDAPVGRRRSPRARRVARLVVVAGSANKTEILLQKTRTNIGRLVDVYKAEGLSRRNDLAFAEDNPVNRTVSREHAHIVHDKKTGEYRLFNDRWYKRGNKAESNCGLWIVRDGMGQEVHRDTRGTRLLPGDEIHLGQAVVKFQVK